MAVTARYLIYFQYCGTNYSGVMKTPSHQPVAGVQNHLEAALQRLRPDNEVTVSISSRTDTGVHAHCNSAHFDLRRKKGKEPFPEELLVSGLNFHLKPEPISILKAFRVSDTFHARFGARSRTYTYRLVTGCAHRSHLPVFERNLCWPVSSRPLNTDAMREAASLLLGTHDFSTFRSLNSETPFKSPLKTLLQAELTPGTSIATQQTHHSHLEFLDLTFRSPSFLYKQVRRMTGALVAVGRGRLTPQHIGELLECRDSRAYPGSFIAPPSGLFLNTVEYDENDLRVKDDITG
ncbi:tRNA pseudouridine synthase-like 1 isoform X2 [Leucoraja erinacea]|uniref:tRNA pseudouridine synthase-like 1 isoform X2 n=1 Tax=Leucoraja erinaceus TaxID=7782 RepID=UPI002455F4DC|nr:tRNA pseudouridine synthase-like 1 isoform X2 [Leucoraja erinacea]